MKLTVVLHQQEKDEVDCGTFRAYVSQNGLMGRNLLGRRHITNADNARREAERELFFTFGAHQVELDWRVV